MPTATIKPDRLRTFGSGDHALHLPVDVLGRHHYRAAIDRSSVIVKRSSDATAAIPFTGTSILFNKRTWIGPRDAGFWEQIAPEAVTKTLLEADVRFLQNHNPDLLLARTNPQMREQSAATLVLTPTPAGLGTEADMAPTSYAHDLAILLERGDISQMSFAFEPIEWLREQLADGSLLITITELRLYDVSVVTYPAYVETDAGLRAAAFDAICRDNGYDPEGVLRGYAMGGTMPELDTAPITDRAAPAMPASAQTKRAQLLEPEERALNGWDFDDLWPILDAAIVDYCSTPDFNAYWYVWLVKVSDTWLVYRDTRPGADKGLYRMDYTISAEGQVTLGEPVKVFAKTTFIPAVEAITPGSADEPGDVGDADPETELGDSLPAVETRTDDDREDRARELAFTEHEKKLVTT